MESWQKIVLSRLILHPRLKTLRPYQFRKVLEFVELAARCDDIYGRIGVVELLDDEIAAELEMNTHQFLLLRDEMLLRDIVRMTGPVRSSRYEVAFWLLPDQTARDHSIQDGRTKELWDKEAPAPDTLFPDFSDPRDTSKKARSGRERTALSRWRGKFTQTNRRRPTSREEALYLEEYRERVRTEEAAAAEGEGFPSLLSSGNETSQPECNAFPNVTLQTTELEQKLREDNNNKPPTEAESGNESSVVVAFMEPNVTLPEPPNVTPLREENVTPKEAQPPLVTGEPVITPALLAARLSSWDVAHKTATQLVETADPTYLWQQLNAMENYIAAEETRTKEPLRNRGGFVRRVVEGKWPLPKDYLERKARTEEKARREVEAVQQKAAAAERAAQGAQEEERLAAFERDLPPDKQVELEAQARERMTDLWRKKLEKYEADGQTPSVPVREELELCRKEVLREWMI